MTRIIFAFSLLFIFSFSGAQEVFKDSVPKDTFNSIGGKHWGIGWGNDLYHYSGIRYVSEDYNCNMNGLNISVLAYGDYRNKSKMNGISFGLVNAFADKMNGVMLSTFVTNTEKLNGVSMGGIVAEAGKGNGLMIGGLVANSNYYLNGIELGGIDASADNVNGISFGGISSVTFYTLNGIGIGGVVAKAEKANGMLAGLVTFARSGNGIQLGLINYAGLWNGFQFGLINHIAENPHWCRTLPFINFNFSWRVHPMDSVDRKDSLGDVYTTVTHYYNKRMIKNIFHYMNGKPEGRFSYFKTNGVLEKDSIYSSGYFSRTIEYSRKGLTIREEIYKGKELWQRDTSFIIQYKNNGQTKFIRAYYADGNYSCCVTGKDTLNMFMNGKWEGKCVWDIGNRPLMNVGIYENGSPLHCYRIFSEDFEQVNEKQGIHILFKEGDTLDNLCGDGPDFYNRRKLRNFCICDTAKHYCREINLYRSGRVERIMFSKDSCQVDSEFYRDGDLASIYFYSGKKNDLTLERSFFRSGKLKRVIHEQCGSNRDSLLYRNGKLYACRDTGEYRFYRKNGALKYRVKRNRTAGKQYYGNGNLHYEAFTNAPNFQRDYASIVKIYRKDGTLKVERNYDEGKKIYYDKKWNIEKTEENVWGESDLKFLYEEEMDGPFMFY